MKKIIISLGGSLIFPKKIDREFLRNFCNLLLRQKNYRFAIYCGGGSLARQWQKKGKTAKEKDWLGIYATRINALILRSMLKNHAEDKIIINPLKKVSWKKKIILAAGWKPGWSTDYDAVLLAKNLEIKTIVNMTDVDYVYDKDPRKYKDAKPIKSIIWKDFRKLLPKKWKPGLKAPFDPLAAKLAEKTKAEVVIVGRSLKNLDRLLKGEIFIGTVIS